MRIKDPGRIKIFLKDPNKKNYFRIFKEFMVLLITKRELPMYYFKHLYKKEIKNYRDYLGTVEIARIHTSKKLHKLEYTSILSNKLNFSLYCERNEIKTPRLISYNFGSSFFLKSRIWEVSNLGDLLDFYKDVFDSDNVEAIFFRPLALNGGSGCFRLDRDTFSRQLEAEYENLLSGDYTHTEAIKQHYQINAIYNKSINTLRILTHFEKGNVAIISSMMRIGVGGNIVDNASSGGLFVGIDQEHGTLKRKAYRNLKFGGEELEKHPNTGFEFENFQIPYFEEACSLAMDAAKYIPNSLVGWDIAIAPDGPTIIEGNEDAGLFVSDVAYGGLLKNPQMKELICRIN